MKKVKLGGRELSVEDEFVPRYLAQGYSVIDTDGTVLQEGEVATLDVAKVRIAKLTANLAALKAENCELKAKIAKLQGEDGEDAPDDNAAPGSFACPHCGKEYKTEKGLAAHIQKEHA